MTGIVNGQCAVEQPQSGVTPLEIAATDMNAEADILFFNYLATALNDTTLPNFIDLLEDLGQYGQRITRDLGSKT
jgi:hypothetical protein